MIVRLVVSLCLLTLASCQMGTGDPDYAVAKWNNLKIDFQGPETSELAENNPFLNYRLDVVFSTGEHRVIVPAFYAADGNAAESSADAGTIWRVNFRPDQEGDWKFEAYFRKGDSIVYEDDLTIG